MSEISKFVGLNVGVGKYLGVCTQWIWYNTKTYTLTTYYFRMRWPWRRFGKMFIADKSSNLVMDDFVWDHNLFCYTRECVDDLRALKSPTQQDIEKFVTQTFKFK